MCVYSPFLSCISSAYRPIDNSNTDLLHFHGLLHKLLLCCHFIFSVKEAPWIFDTDATSFIQDLLKAEVKCVPFKRMESDNDGNVNKIEEELHVIKLNSTLQSNERATTSILVVPPRTRGAWKVLIQGFQSGVSDQRFLVVGSAGVGKSRTINYLIRELIKQRRQDKSQPLHTIVFEHRKDAAVWRFDSSSRLST